MYTLQKGRIRKTEMKPNTATPMATSYKHQRFDALAGHLRGARERGPLRGSGWAAPPGQGLTRRTQRKSNLKPILHKPLLHLTPKGRRNWDPTGKVGSPPPTPFNCQHRLWRPQHSLPGSDTHTHAHGAAGSAGAADLEVGAAGRMLLCRWGAGLPQHSDPVPGPVAASGSVTGAGWVEPLLGIACPVPRRRPGHTGPSPCKDNQEWN